MLRSKALAERSPQDKKGPRSLASYRPRHDENCGTRENFGICTCGLLEVLKTPEKPTGLVTVPSNIAQAKQAVYSAAMRCSAYVMKNGVETSSEPSARALQEAVNELIILCQQKT